MKPSILAVCVLLSGSVLVRAADTGTVAEFEALEQKMSDSLLKGDAAGFEKQVAEDWKIVLGDARIMTLAQVKEGIATGKLKFQSVKLSEVEVRTYGDTAIVIGVNETIGWWEGNNFEGRDRFTDVFVKKDGAWKCVASHSSTIQEE
jgi:hypothetical protein